MRAVALRPESVGLLGGAEDDNRMAGAVEDVDFLGSIVRIRVRLREQAISLDTFNNPSATLPRVGQALTVSFPREAVLALERAPSPEEERGGPREHRPRGEGGDRHRRSAGSGGRSP